MNKMKTDHLSIIHIIDEYESLRKGLKFIINNSKSNTAPYHNLNHMLTVTRHVYNALDYMFMLEDERVEELLLAALFHDYNHSMGKQTDDINVAEAKKGLRAFLTLEKLEMDIEFMESILDATEYPYKLHFRRLNFYQKLIRDCDLCQAYEYNWLQQCVYGLSQEMGFTFKELLAGQRKFLQSITFLTDYGLYVEHLYFKKLMIEFKILEDIME